MAPTNIVKPTLLSKYSPTLLTRSSSTSWLMSEKLDGWRALYVKETETFYSRSGNPLALPARFYLAAFKLANDIGVDFLDGELWCGRKTGSGAVPAAMVNADDTTLRYMVFDAWKTGDQASALERYRRCEGHGDCDSNVIQILSQTVVVDSKSPSIEAFYKEVLAGGGEGVVFKPVDMPVYTDGRRASLYLKWKQFETQEFKVVGHCVTTAKATTMPEGYVSSLVCEAESGKTFKVSFKNFSAPAVGEWVTVRFSDTTVTGIPKFPVYEGRRHPADKPKPESPPSTPSPSTPSLTLKTPATPATPTTSNQTQTFTQWTQQGGYQLSKGEAVFVISDTDPAMTYKVAMSANSSSVYCSCLAWKYQRLNPAVRTCKHCIAVCGAQAERVRCAKATLCLQQMNEMMGKNFKI